MVAVVSTPPPQISNRGFYLNSDKQKYIKIALNETKICDSDVTKVSMEINLKDYNIGMSLELLNEVIKAATVGLSRYRIYHSAKGLFIEGTY